MEEDADTGTPFIVTNLPGSALFIQLCCTGCGARPRANGDGRPLLAAAVFVKREFCLQQQSPFHHILSLQLSVKLSL
jgi:hypothetical protein